MTDNALLSIIINILAVCCFIGAIIIAIYDTRSFMKFRRKCKIKFGGRLTMTNSKYEINDTELIGNVPAEKALCRLNW